ncbi:hypothetical protein [Paenibacillus sinopodophylli]|uniref:hypothetical protein n=1 Tax=Paenibacillus sinopodophylli TaxID=1837342 RepID=UPI00110C93B4|nr:hypothetical protein [Paenibacillus sinopodophylli]
MLKVRDLVEVVKPFYWLRDEQFEIGERFIFEAQHVGHGFEAWVKKVDDKVFVYRLCKCDSVAARSLEEALQWYKDTTGVPDDELYSSEEIEVLSFDYEVYDEDRKGLMSIQQIIDQHWSGEPFIACSTEW